MADAPGGELTVSRKSTGKRLRFEVFKRDGFACQYCGAQPPDVLLVVDHVVPVAKDGDNSPDNLITACEPCNQGKSDRPLGEKRPRPDADLQFLETSQEISELRRYRESAEQRDAEVGALVVRFQRLWRLCADMGDADEADTWAPGIVAFLQLLKSYPPEEIEAMVLVVAPKWSSGQLDRSSWLPYAYGVLRRNSENQPRFYPHDRLLAVSVFFAGELLKRDEDTRKVFGGSAAELLKLWLEEGYERLNVPGLCRAYFERVSADPPPVRA